MVITLVGYRATGKSTVGGRLAARLGWTFVDLDREIEREAGRTIAEMFAVDGEPFFRSVESRALQSQLTRDRLVLAPGGGAVLDAVNRERIRQAGPVVWLRAGVDTIAARLNRDATTATSRPSLTGRGVAAEVAEVLAVREPLYAETASIVVDTDNRPIEGLVDDIMAQLPSELKGCR